jgi:hypothetical protein
MPETIDAPVRALFAVIVPLAPAWSFLNVHHSSYGVGTGEAESDDEAASVAFAGQVKNLAASCEASTTELTGAKQASGNVSRKDSTPATESYVPPVG